MASIAGRFLIRSIVTLAHVAQQLASGSQCRAQRGGRRTTSTLYGMPFWSTRTYVVQHFVFWPTHTQLLLLIYTILVKFLLEVCPWLSMVFSCRVHSTGCGMGMKKRPIRVACTRQSRRVQTSHPSQNIGLLVEAPSC